MIDNRLALAALRGVMQELDANPTGAAGVVARLFGAPLAHRDLKPANVLVVDQGDEAEATRLGREMLAAAASGGNDEDDAAAVGQRMLEEYRASSGGAPRARTKAAGARRREARPARPAPAARGNRGGGPRMGEPDEVKRLAGELLERHGSVRAAADALGGSQGSMRRLLEGRATAAGLDRLRAALAAVDDDLPAEGQEAHAGPSPAPQGSPAA